MSVTVPAATDEVLATWGQEVARFINFRGAIAASTASITTSQTLVVAVTVTANQLVAGSTYRLEAWGTCTSSGANAVTLRVRVGTTTLTGNIAGSIAPTATATAAGEGFRVSALFTCRTAGASGTCLAQMEVFSAETGEPFSITSPVSVTNSTVAVDTTVGNYLELTAVTADAATSVIFRSAVIERVV